MKRYGVEWESTGDGWRGTVLDAPRYHPHTWQFGSIHQCVVDIDVKGASDPRGVHMCLAAQKTRDAAMRHAVEWVRAYQKRGPLSVEDTLRECFDHYPTIYRTRLGVANHIFCVIGNGYDWLDGAVISTSEYEPERAATEDAAWRDRFRESMKDMPELLVKMEARDAEEAEELKRPRPFPDDGQPVRFYPASKGYSLLCEVPDDARPDWLAFAYETARALRDRSADDRDEDKASGDRRAENNRRIGSEVCADLESRFPQLRDL